MDNLDGNAANLHKDTVSASISCSYSALISPECYKYFNPSTFCNSPQLLVSINLRIHLLAAEVPQLLLCGAIPSMNRQQFLTLKIKKQNTV
jgi:hypothetical protein